MMNADTSMFGSVLFLRYLPRRLPLRTLLLTPIMYSMGLLLSLYGSQVLPTVVRGKYYHHHREIKLNFFSVANNVFLQCEVFHGEYLMFMCKTDYFSYHMNHQWDSNIHYSLIQQTLSVNIYQTITPPSYTLSLP